MPSINILLIEDNEDHRDLFMNAVADSLIKAQVACAPDAVEAIARLGRLDRFRHEPVPDLVILDLGLPVVSGESFLRVVQKSAGPLHIPIIIWSGSDDHTLETRYKELGAAAFQRKPLHYKDLVIFVSILPEFVRAYVAGQKKG